MLLLCECWLEAGKLSSTIFGPKRFRWLNTHPDFCKLIWTQLKCKMFYVSFSTSTKGDKAWQCKHSSKHHLKTKKTPTLGWASKNYPASLHHHMVAGSKLSQYRINFSRGSKNPLTVHARSQPALFMGMCVLPYRPRVPSIPHVSVKRNKSIYLAHFHNLFLQLLKGCF